MATSANKGGQRNNNTGGNGAKKRSPTSTPHRGSRVEPSHITRGKRAARAKKA